MILVLVILTTFNTHVVIFVNYFLSSMYKKVHISIDPITRLETRKIIF